MELSFFNSIGLHLGRALLWIVGSGMVLELLMRLWNAFANKFVYSEIRRASYLPAGYQDYIKLYDDWTRSIFEYLPVGLRFFNRQSSISGRVINNSIGFRGPEFRPREPDELRIVLLGGSAAWSSGASSNETTIAGWLEKIIRDDGRLLRGKWKTASVVNLAQIMNYQTQDLIHAALHLPTLQPQFVFSYTGWNEFIASNRMSEEVIKKFEVYPMEELMGWEPTRAGANRVKILKYALRLTLARYSHVVRFFVPEMHRSPMGDLLPAPRKISDNVKLIGPLFCRYLKALEAVCRGNGSRHVQFLQPTIYRKPNVTSDEQRVLKLYDELRPIHGGMETARFMRNQSIYKYVHDHTGSPEYGDICDLYDLFMNDKEDVFQSLVHLTDFGYRRVAQAMYEKLLEMEK